MIISSYMKKWEIRLPKQWEISLPNQWEKYLTFTIRLIAHHVVVEHCAHLVKVLKFVVVCLCLHDGFPVLVVQIHGGHAVVWDAGVSHGVAYLAE